MPTLLTCPRCKTPIHLNDEVAGQVVACPNCGQEQIVPAEFATGGTNRRMERVLGKQPPLIFDILGIHTKWSSEFSTDDVLQLLWSLRHVAILFLVLVFFVHFSNTAESAAVGAPLFFWIGVVVFVISWIQVNRISAGLTNNISTRRSKGMLARVLAAALLVVTDFRASLPALRTLFLSLCMIFAGLRLAENSGSYGSILPLGWLPTGGKPATTQAYRPPMSEEEKARQAQEEQEERARAAAATRPAKPAATKPAAEDLPLPPPPEDGDVGK